MCVCVCVCVLVMCYSPTVEYHYMKLPGDQFVLLNATRNTCLRRQVFDEVEFFSSIYRKVQVTHLRWSNIKLFITSVQVP